MTHVEEATESFHASTCRLTMCDKVSCFSSFYYAIMNFGIQLVPEWMRWCWMKLETWIKRSAREQSLFRRIVYFEERQSRWDWCDKRPMEHGTQLIVIVNRALYLPWIANTKAHNGELWFICGLKRFHSFTRILVDRDRSHLQIKTSLHDIIVRLIPKKQVR